MSERGLIENWLPLAACRDGDPDVLFIQGAAQNDVKRICRGCPVRNECLVRALDNRIEFGVWGGMTERERRALLRKHPNVSSWRKIFEAALRKHSEDSKRGVEVEPSVATQVQSPETSISEVYKFKVPQAAGALVLNATSGEIQESPQQPLMQESPSSLDTPIMPHPK